MVTDRAGSAEEYKITLESKSILASLKTIAAHPKAKRNKSFRKVNFLVRKKHKENNKISGNKSFFTIKNNEISFSPRLRSLAALVFKRNSSKINRPLKFLKKKSFFENFWFISLNSKNIIKIK